MSTVLHGASPCTTEPEPRRPAGTPATPGPASGPVVRGLPCWTADPELFFAEEPAAIDAAKQLCADCPIQAGCLAGALDRAEPWGVWGGELFDRGAIVPRKRPRGRPSNVDRARDAAWRTAHDLTSVA